MIPLLYGLTLSAQQKEARGVVVDSAGHPIAGVFISSGPGQQTRSDAAGGFTAPVGMAVQFSASGYVTSTVTIGDEQSARVVLAPAGPLQEVTVTAYRTPLPSNESPVSVRVLTGAELQQSASPSLDDKLRQIPGAELFRRSSSRVANPTSQGISLRGLGSTAASRTLVVADDVPQNDPFGGWIHWQEMPELSVQSVEVVRGGASDLYGSSAIGGVINVIPVRPTTDALSMLASYGGQNTREIVGLAQGTHNEWAGLASAGAFFTDGFILVAPSSRGPVDIPSNVYAENAFADMEHASHSTRIFLHGSGFNEQRSNGTPIQNNGTRLWRYAGGLDWANASGGTLGARLYGSTESFWQTFSSISPDRTTERLTRYASSPANELGAVAHWQQTLSQTIVLVAGADVRDVRAEDNETAYPTLRQTDISVRQRQTGVYGEALWIPGKWTFTVGLRGDFFRNLDAVQYLPTSQPLPELSENVVNPRLGVVRRLGTNFALTASAFRAFRAPTPNELYRNGQVGQELTLANPNLLSERATGWEAGTQVTWRSSTLRGSYFWTQVNRPITALTLTTTPTQIVKRRENLGQIESRGIAIDFETSPTRWLALVGGYQFANATVTQSPLQPQLEGNWIPQVARNMGTVQANFRSALLGSLSIQMRASGQQYDDDANQYRLAGYFRLDANYARNFGGSDGQRYQVFASAEDLTNQPMQVGRTPTLTLGTPLVGRIGIRMAFPSH
jgi:outer membrane receptor protein involved in Fe transport